MWRLMRAIVATSASAASAFNALWRPTSDSDDVGTSKPPPCASQVVPSKRTSPHSPSAAGTPAPIDSIVRPGMRMPNDSGSSRLTTWMPPCAKMRAFAAA